jgi:hypothetical protein
MHKYPLFLVALSMVASLSPLMHAQERNASIRDAIAAKFPLTKATDDRSDIVTAGAAVALERDGLLMYAANVATHSSLNYKDGKFQSSGLSKWHNFNNGWASFNKSAGVQNEITEVPHRIFVTGEKFWLVGVDLHDDGPILEFLSDQISDVRYRAFVKFPYPKGAQPTPDAIVASISEAIKVSADAPQQDAQQTQQLQKPQQQSAAPAAAAAPMVPIAPPPPPTDAAPAQPKTIALGQTKDMVTANFGQPAKIVKLGTREIDYYPDMKVTFVNNKVTDVQ